MSAPDATASAWNRPSRWTVVVIGAAPAWWASAADGWLVGLILLAPFVRLATLPAPRTEWRAWRSFLLAGVIGVVLAGLQHKAIADALGGTIRPGQVAWSGWFFFGAIVALEAVNLGARRLLRPLGKPGLETVGRLAAVLLVALPLLPAVVYAVRAKPGYTMPAEAQQLDPQPFHAESKDGRRLRGYFFDRGHENTVVAVHGLGAHAGNFVPYLTALLNEHAVNGLMIDLRAHGYSDGHVTSFGHHERKDVRAAVRWLRDRHPQRAEGLIFYGFSIGAAAALPVAAETDETLGVVVDSGYARLTDVAWGVAGGLPPGTRRYSYYAGLGAASLLTEAPLWRLRPAEMLDRLEAPVRVLHGGGDGMIGAEQGRALLDHPRTDGAMIPGGEHANLPASDPTYFERVGRFIETLLAEPAGTSDSSEAHPQGPTLRAPE